MAAMTAVLTEFSNSGNSRTSTLVSHTAIKPKLVIEKRRVAEAGQVVAEQSIKIVYGTVDADNLPLQQKVTFEVVVRYPITGNETDIASALGTLRDVVASDNFANSVSTQEWL